MGTLAYETSLHFATFMTPIYVANVSALSSHFFVSHYQEAQNVTTKQCECRIGAIDAIPPQSFDGLDFIQFSITILHHMVVGQFVFYVV